MAVKCSSARWMSSGGVEKSANEAFQQKYGPWALVAGGAQGIGETYARYAAARGVNIIAIDNKQWALDEFAPALTKEFNVECLPLCVDLAANDMLEQVVDAVGDREVGLLVYNATISTVGPFFAEKTDLAFEKARITVNVSGPILLTYHFAKPMLARGAGGIIYMCSQAGLKGSPYYAAYSATKSHNIALGQALWCEFKPYNVDVLSVAAGMTLSSVAADFKHLDTSGFQTTEQVVGEAMEVLGKQPLIISGANNRADREKMKDLPDEDVIAIMADHAITNFFGGTRPDQAI